MAAGLIPAGLEFLERIGGQVTLPLPVPPPFHSPASRGPEHGRFDARPDEVIDVNGPHMSAKVHAGWWHMATEYQVLDARREVLLSVDYSDPGEAKPSTSGPASGGPISGTWRKRIDHLAKRIRRTSMTRCKSPTWPTITAAPTTGRPRTSPGYVAYHRTRRRHPEPATPAGIEVPAGTGPSGLIR